MWSGLTKNYGNSTYILYISVIVFDNISFCSYFIHSFMCVCVCLNMFSAFFKFMLLLLVSKTRPLSTHFLYVVSERIGSGLSLSVYSFSVLCHSLFSNYNCTFTSIFLPLLFIIHSLSSLLAHSLSISLCLKLIFKSVAKSIPIRSLRVTSVCWNS